MRAFRVVNYFSLLSILHCPCLVICKLSFSMTFHDRRLNSVNFQAWKMKLLNSMTFQGFHDLCETWTMFCGRTWCPHTKLIPRTIRKDTPWILNWVRPKWWLNKALLIEKNIYSSVFTSVFFSLICVLRSLLEKTLRQILTLSSSSSEDSTAFTKKSKTDEE